MMLPATDTVTRAGFDSIAIGWLGPGSLIDLVSMALVVPAVDVNQWDLCGTRLGGISCIDAHSLKSAPNMGRPLLDSVGEASSSITSQCSTSTPSTMRTMSAAIQFFGRPWPEKRPWT